MARVPPLFMDDESELDEQFHSVEAADAAESRSSPGNFNLLLRYQIERKLGKSSYLVTDQMNNCEL